MKDVFGEAEVEIVAENKQDIDRIIHGLVKVEYKNCPEAWKQVKKRLSEDREGFITALKVAFSGL